MKLRHMEELIAGTGVHFGTSGVRGLVAHMTNEICYAYTNAFLQTVATYSKTVVIGHDLRPSSPQIAAACARAIEDAGYEVLYAGALPTPALAFFASQMNAAAIVVTGSHIPFDRNGIKFYRAQGEISKLDERNILNALVRMPEKVKPVQLPQPNPLAYQRYVNRYLDFFGADALSGMRIAVYEHSSVARDVLRDILEGLGAHVLSLGRTDTFVPIDTEAVRTEDIHLARQWALEHDFDALLSTDGDADRPLIADERGQWMRGDIVGILCAQYLQAKVVVTPVSSNTAVEKSCSFMQVRRTRIGSPYVIAEMEAAIADHCDAVMGYEANGGFLLGSDIVRSNAVLQALPTRDAVLPILALLCQARQSHCTLSAVTGNLPPRFTASDRLQNIPHDTSHMLINWYKLHGGALAGVISPETGRLLTEDETDGLRMTFDSGEIIHLRPSGNAPELRCYTEADSSYRAHALVTACLGHVSSLLEEALLK